MNDIKVKLVSIEDGVTALGFRRIVAIARKLNPSIDVYFITTGNLYSLITHLIPSFAIKITNKDIENIASELAKADLLCFSSMTPTSNYVEKIARVVKRKNPRIFILWGGAHCIINPDKAIKHVDAICTGEGEIPFQKFYQALVNHESYLNCPNFWFRVKNKIIKNPIKPLNTPEELNSFPHLFYDYDCQIFDLQTKKFRPYKREDFLNFNGLSYRTIWTLGCPYSCIYCANDTFVSIDKNYRKIRHSSINYILDEIEAGIKIYPFVSTVVFYDDNFIAISTEQLKKFAKEYKKRINLPFVIFGLHPNIVTKEKMDLLGRTGMRRGRMGIQTGCVKTLAFYQRPTPIAKIKTSVEILADAARKYHMIPPSYDIISDNPIESRDDVIDSFKFLYALKRPYVFTVFSLRVFPHTKLYDYFKKHPTADIRQLTSSYLETRKTLTNILLYLLSVVKPPRSIFHWLLKHVKGYQEKQPTYPVIYWFIKVVYLVNRAIPYLTKLDFSTIVGPWGFYIWRMGFIKSKFRIQAKRIANKVISA